MTNFEKIKAELTIEQVTAYFAMACDRYPCEECPIPHKPFCVGIRQWLKSEAKMDGGENDVR